MTFAVIYLIFWNFLIKFCHLLVFQGICPGNRLKIINYDSGIYSPLSSPCPSSIGMTTSTSTLSSQTIQASEMYENTSNGNQQKQGKRRSWHIMPNKVRQRCILYKQIRSNILSVFPTLRFNRVFLVFVASTTNYQTKNIYGYCYRNKFFCFVVREMANNGKILWI